MPHNLGLACSIGLNVFSLVITNFIGSVTQALEISWFTGPHGTRHDAVPDQAAVYCDLCTTLKMKQFDHRVAISSC